MSKLIRRLFSKSTDYFCIQKTSSDRKEEFHCILVNNDKVVFLAEVDNLADLESYTMLLPSLRDLILETVLDGNEKIYVNDQSRIIDVSDVAKQKDTTESEIEDIKRLNIPSFLWDLYVVGFLKVKNNEFLPIEEVESIKRNQFIARKVVIQYTNIKDLVRKFYENIYPERMMVDLLSNIKAPEISANEIMKNIDLKSIISFSKEFEGIELSDVNSELIISYLDKIIEEYIG